MTEAEVRAMYRRITEKLIKEKLTVTTMESCTSGTVASLLTDTEGASAVLPGAFVTYSNRGKVLAGVPEETIREYGVYSAETAVEMAKACRKTYGTDIGIGVTGSFGNADPANPDSVPGVVYFCIDFRGTLTPGQLKGLTAADRHAYKIITAGEIGGLLNKLL